IEAYATETGAGQWGSALALATNYFGLRSKVFMVRVSYDQKPYRKYVMRLFGAEVIPSPSDRTNVGKKILAQDPTHPGSLGVANWEAIRTAVTSPHTRYPLGSVLNHVLLHQTVIGLEAQKQFELADVTPDFMVGSVGGGSNFAGFTYPTIGERIHGRSDTRFIAVEPTSVPSMTKGRYEYDFGDTGEMTPLVKMHTLGHTFVPPRIHAGGLRYHGTAATLSVLLDAGLVEPRAVDQVSTFQAGEIFAKTEGLIAAPETCHAIRGAIDLAHGTTVATNAILQRKGARTVFVTTAGFEDLLIIGRQDRPNLYDFHVTRASPPVDSEMCLGADERVDARGRPLRPLTEREARRIAREVRSRKAESVAICLLFSFMRPSHERILRDALGDLPVSMSHEVLSEFREYERASTTVLDAYLKPLVGRYLTELRAAIRKDFFVMKSGGGVAVHSAVGFPSTSPSPQKGSRPSHRPCIFPGTKRSSAPSGLSKPRWRRRCGWSSPVAALTRGILRCSPSAAPGRCTHAPSPNSSGS